MAESCCLGSVSGLGLRDPNSRPQRQGSDSKAGGHRQKPSTRRFCQRLWSTENRTRCRRLGQYHDFMWHDVKEEAQEVAGFWEGRTAAVVGWRKKTLQIAPAHSGASGACAWLPQMALGCPMALTHMELPVSHCPGSHMRWPTQLLVKSCGTHSCGVLFLHVAYPVAWCSCWHR